MAKEKKSKVVILDLVTELYKNKEGKVLDKKTFKQKDAWALMQLLSFYNSKIGTFRDFQKILSLHDKVQNAWRKEAKTMELTIDEAAFLKDYLENFNERSASIPIPTGLDPNRLTEFRLRTLVTIVEQLE